MGKWLASPETLTFEVRDRIAWITFNRPEKRNAQNTRSLRELNDALREADDLKSVSCVVLQGAGKDFCSGADISDGIEPGADAARAHNPDDYRGRAALEDDIWHTRYGSNLRLDIFRMHKPVIGKVQGNCLAVGTDIALNCDMVIASDDARIGFPATRALGSPANHMWLYLIGPQWAKRMLMTGDVLRGGDAARLGLVLEAVPAGDLDETVRALAARVALTDPALLAAHKRVVNMGLELMGWEALQRYAAENDARSHQAAATGAFFDTVKNQGIKAALQQRDAPFGSDEITFTAHRADTKTRALESQS
ncbi:MAG: Enoyl-CoA hydratase/isomerase family protein [Brevundimonas sp.]|nr:Enoyl-CoA hydratase/isomerase family protein [Brevundimonas sp.]